VLLGGLAAAVFVLCAGAALDSLPADEETWDAVMIALGLALTVSWGVLAVFVHTGAVRASRFDGSAIELKGVAQGFVTAFVEEREQLARALDQAAQERWGERHPAWEDEDHVRSPEPGEPSSGAPGGVQKP
jgi:hypothetical protein